MNVALRRKVVADATHVVVNYLSSQCEKYPFYAKKVVANALLLTVSSEILLKITNMNAIVKSGHR